MQMKEMVLWQGLIAINCLRNVVPCLDSYVFQTSSKSCPCERRWGPPKCPNSKPPVWCRWDVDACWQEGWGGQLRFFFCNWSVLRAFGLKPGSDKKLRKCHARGVLQKRQKRFTADGFWKLKRGGWIKCLVFWSQGILPRLSWDPDGTVCRWDWM